MTDLTDAPPQPTHTIAAASASTGVSIDTLRYYERAGVLPDIRRTDGGQRAYSDDDLGWIGFVRRLRATGVPMRRIAEYTAMVRAGEGTLAERRRMLKDHRDTVAAAREELTAALAVLHHKIAHYAAAERGVDISCSEAPMRHVPQLG